MRPDQIVDRVHACTWMIRHRPYGRGHPYLLEPDQRVPAQVVAGERLELRASTDPLVRRVLVEFDDERPPLEAHLRGRATADEITDYSSPTPHRPSASHLSRPATDDARSGRLSWAATLDRVDDRFRY